MKASIALPASMPDVLFNASSNPLKVDGSSKGDVKDATSKISI